MMNKKARSLFFYALNETLDLKYDVRILLSRKASDHCAEYFPDYSDDGKLQGHDITMYTREIVNDGRTFETILAHELIHAWQEEKGYTEIHGPHFRRMAKKLARKYSLRDVYVASVDKP